MKRKKFLILIGIAILIFTVGSATYYYTSRLGYLRLNYPSSEDYPIQGIDVSHHQGNIEWDKIDKKNITFAFIKATEGANHKDSLFVKNWNLAKKQNITVGAYHFFSFCKSGEEQATNYIESVPLDSLALPPIIDLEYGGNCKTENRKQNLIREISVYIDIVERHYHKHVIIYSTHDFYKNKLENKFPNNTIWIRDIINKPELSDKRKWVFWQFTNSATLEGINTKVDLNIFNGNKTEFDNFVNSHIPN